MAIDKLPPELVAKILDHTYYTKGVIDRKTLLACARTCAAWSNHAQRLLFRHVSLGRTHGAYFYAATDPTTERGRTISSHIRVLDVFLTETFITEPVLVEILARCPRLYQLVLHVQGVHQLSPATTERLRALALPLRALDLMSCGIQSPILYQLLDIWPAIRHLTLGVEVAAPLPKFAARVRLTELFLMRTPRPAILEWLLAASTGSLRIATFRDVPPKALDGLLAQLGPGLRSLRLTDVNLRAAAVLRACVGLEELVVFHISGLVMMPALPETMEHFSFREMETTRVRAMDEVMRALRSLPRLKVVTCDASFRETEEFRQVEELCREKGAEIRFNDMPLYVRDDPVMVRRFPRRKSVSNYALMS